MELKLRFEDEAFRMQNEDLSLTKCPRAKPIANSTTAYLHSFQCERKRWVKMGSGGR